MVLVKHRQIAQDLGTSREVITRTIRKLEKENKVRKLKKGLKLFPKNTLGVIKVTCLR
jgi:predicted regulator of amino acid metabolism with ACT domain